MWYVEILKKHCNAVDGTFYDAINDGSQEWKGIDNNVLAPVVYTKLGWMEYT